MSDYEVKEPEDAVEFIQSVLPGAMEVRRLGDTITMSLELEDIMLNLVTTMKRGLVNVIETIHLHFVSQRKIFEKGSSHSLWTERDKLTINGMVLTPLATMITSGGKDNLHKSWYIDLNVAEFTELDVASLKQLASQLVWTRTERLFNLDDRLVPAFNMICGRRILEEALTELMTFGVMLERGYRAVRIDDGDSMLSINYCDHHPEMAS